MHSILVRSAFVFNYKIALSQYTWKKKRKPSLKSDRLQLTRKERVWPRTPDDDASVILSGETNGRTDSVNGEPETLSRPAYTSTCIYIHTRLTALFPGLPVWAGTRKVKSVWILLKQETVSGSGISRAVCKSAPRSRQITTPAPHHSVFLQTGCTSCRPTNSVKALKANPSVYTQEKKFKFNQHMFTNSRTARLNLCACHNEHHARIAHGR